MSQRRGDDVDEEDYDEEEGRDSVPTSSLMTAPTPPRTTGHPAPRTSFSDDDEEEEEAAFLVPPPPPLEGGSNHSGSSTTSNPRVPVRLHSRSSRGAPTTGASTAASASSVPQSPTNPRTTVPMSPRGPMRSPRSKFRPPPPSPRRQLQNRGGVEQQGQLPHDHHSNILDQVLELNLSPSASDEIKRRRSIVSSDVISRVQEHALHDADLKFAEAIHTEGTYRERQEGTSTSGKMQRRESRIMAQVEREEGIDAYPKDFEFNHLGLTSEQAELRLREYGKNELPENAESKWLIFVKLLWGPMPMLIWIGIITEALIHEWMGMSVLIAIQFINASIGFYETCKAGDAVAALKSSLKPLATVKRDGKWQNISASLVVPGDLVLLGSGSAVPADCRVNGNTKSISGSGGIGAFNEIDVDQAMLTGESLPVTFYEGDSVKMGSTVVRGEVEGTVEFTGVHTFLGQTATLLVETHEPSHLQRMLTKIMLVQVILAFVCCTSVFVYLHAFQGENFKETLSFAVVILIASIPLAIEIVTSTTLAIGSKSLSKQGAIVKKLSAIEELAGMSILCSDKTGTLTLNQMVLQEDTPLYADDLDQEQILLQAAMAAKWKEPPRDALDRLTLGSVNADLLEQYEQLSYIPFDPQIKRTEGTVRDTRTGEEFKTSKGAPHIILGLLDPSSENVDVREAVERDVAFLGDKGIRSLAVARTDSSGKWRMQGLLTFLDPPRPDTKTTIDEARELGVMVKMITGDHLLIARNTAEVLGMGGLIFNSEKLPMLDPETRAKPADLSKNFGDLCLSADGFAQVYPEHKYLIVECLRELGYVCGMTGDGVNDAPALKRADLGIAVSGATDAARAAADIVLTEPGLGTIIHAIVVAREIFQRMSNFITYRIAATLQLLFFFFIAIFAFSPSSYIQPPGLEEPWPEFFKMPVLMLMLITLLNDGTLITIAYDYAKANPTPNKWNLPALFMASSVLGGLSCLSSLLLLWLLLDSWNPAGVFQKLGMQGVDYGQITTAVYLKISVSDFMTLFTARTGTKYFWQIPPAPILATGGAIALLLSSLLSIYWPESTPDGIETEGLRNDMGLFSFLWLYCLIFFILQDVMKVMAYRLMHRTNFYGISTTGVVVLPESTQKLVKELQKALDEEGTSGEGGGGSSQKLMKKSQQALDEEEASGGGGERGGGRGRGLGGLYLPL